MPDNQPATAANEWLCPMCAERNMRRVLWRRDDGDYRCVECGSRFLCGSTPDTASDHYPTQPSDEGDFRDDAPVVCVVCGLPWPCPATESRSPMAPDTAARLIVISIAETDAEATEPISARYFTVTAEQAEAVADLLGEPDHRSILGDEAKDHARSSYDAGVHLDD